MRSLEAFGWQARISNLGAELQSFHRSGGAELIWQGDPAFWSGRAPVLFPIVGRADQDRLSLGGEIFHMAQHGFARRMRFDYLGGDASHCIHELRDDAATRAQFPRAFRLRLTHALHPEGLRISAEVENPGPAPLPFGFGFHPALQWPLPGCAGLPHHITLENRAEPLRSPLEGGLLSRSLAPSPFTGGRLTLREGLFDDDALIFLQGAGERLRYGPDGGPGLHFLFENLPFFALWSKPGAGFVCLEPWQGAAAFAGAGPAIEERPGTLTLAPGARHRFAIAILPEAAKNSPLEPDAHQG